LDLVIGRYPGPVGGGEIVVDQRRANQRIDRGKGTSGKGAKYRSHFSNQDIKRLTIVQTRKDDISPFQINAARAFVVERSTGDQQAVTQGRVGKKPGA